MSLSVEQVRQMREQIKANDAAKTAAQKKKTTTQTAKTTPAAPAAKSAGTGLSVAQVAQIRSQMTAAPASTSRLQTTASTPAWTGGTRQVLGTVSADTLGKQVLADMASNTGSPVATDRQEDYEPDWNYVGSDNAPKQRAIAQGTYGSYAKAAQKVGNALAKDRQTDRFDELNQWMDESPRHREVVDLLRQKEYTTQEDKGVAPEQAVQVTGTKQRYSPGDLLKMGYTAQEINEARAYIREYDALPVTDRAMRRTADTTKGIAATVASAVPMAGEMTTQGVKDIRATQKNEAALDKELEGDARGKELKDRITAVDMDYNPQYTDEDLRGMGYSQSEIDEMRSRIAGTVQKTALDKDTSLGYQLYHYGQQRTEAAQAGMSPVAKTAMGVATSAAENLAVAGVSPYLVLPVLSAQGAAESMGQDVEKGTSAGQAVGVGLAKFGAGWAINSVGVADMARSMGVDYARDTVAGKLADLVRSSKLVSGLGNSQLAANTISGGVDNAVQAFVETYADKIIDATLGGDQQAADELLQSDTFLQALQSGLTGGASGALGGAVGTGLGAMSRTLDARAGTETAAPVQADTESRAADAAAAQRALEARAMEPGEAARQQADQAAAVQQTDNADAAETTAQKDAAPAVRSENPAVQQLAAALQADNLTGKTINLFTPNAANAANRAAFAEEYGMELPATASETRKALRTLAQQQTAEQAMQQEAEAHGTNVGNKAAQVKNPAADQRQSTVEKAGETVESGQGYSVSMSNDTMTVRFADGTEAVRTVDPENPRTMLFDPEQLHRQAQAESRAEVQQEAPAQQQSPAEYADVELRADPAALETDSWTRGEQVQTAQELAQHYRMSTQAVQTVVNNMPAGIGAEIYAPAAASLYRLGVNGEGASFAEALQMTGKGSALSGRVQQVLALGDAGRTALNLAYLQGKGEAERYQETRAAELGKRPGKAALREDAGTYYKADGSVSKGTRADDALIELSAKASGVAAQRVVQGLANNAKGLIQSAAGKVFYSSEADAATVMHETLHELNRWDNAGGQELIDTFEHYLVQQNGMDSVQELVQSYLDRYERAGQQLTYNQAMEEITADAMRSIFGTEEDFRNYVRQQAAEARMNAQAQKRSNRVMQKIETLLQKVLTDIQTLLGAEPDNAAARAAHTLTETQLKDLRQIYFNHQADAGTNYRAALEANGGMEKAAAADAAAAEGERYSIDERFEDEIESLNKKTDDYMITVGKTSDVLKSIGVKDQTILWNAGKIKEILKKHSEVRYKAGKEKSIMTPDIIKQVPQVLENPVVVLHSNEETGANQGKNYRSRIYMFGEVKDALNQPVSVSLELLPTRKNGLVMDNIVLTSAYGKNNVQNALNSDQILYIDPNKKRTAAWLGSTGLQLPVPPTMYGSRGTLTYFGESVKMMDANSRNAKLAQFMTQEGENRYQLDVDSEDVEAARRQSVGDGGAETETLAKVMAQADAAQVSDESLERIARKMVKTSDSRADVKTLTSRLAALRNYLSGGSVDWAQAHGFVLDMAQQVMEGSAKKNDELWKAYPDLHKMSMSLEKGSKDYNEVLYKYGSWAEARKELAKHGVSLTLTKKGEVSRWDADFTELQGIGGGLFPTETPSSAADALEAMAAAHDAIKPTMESAYDSEWDAAKQELAMDLWNEYLGLPGVANSRNAKLRAEFKARTEQMNEQAKRHSLALQAEANLNAAKQRASDRQKMRQPYADRMTKAQQDYKEAAARAEAKLGAKERKLEQQAAVLREAERGKTREKIAIAQAKNAERLAQMRDSRDKDNTRRAIRKATSELTKMFEHPNEKKYVPEYLLDKVQPVLQLANEAIGNRETAQRLAQWSHRGEEGWTYAPMQDSKAAMEKAVHGLRDGIKREMENSDRAQLEWENSGLQDAIDEWLLDVNDNREREIEVLRAKIENAKQYTREDESPSWTAYVDGLNDRLAALKNGGMATLSSTELRGLRDIIDQTLHIIKTDNVVVGAAEDVMIDEFAEGVKSELTDAKGVSKKPGALGRMSRALNSYKMNTMNIERMFERLGGYTHGGYMENLGKMLNDGQRKKTKILIEGTRVFDELTGPKHEKELYHFTHDLVDIGLKDDSGKARKITHNQLAELALQLQNKQGVHHILTGGLTLENMEAKLSGDTELAKLDKATVRVGQLTVTDSEGSKPDAAALSQNEDAERRTLLEEVDKHLTDYDRAWMAAWKTLNARMTGYINETSMLLSGVKKATTENYIHINVDGDTNLEQNKGIRYDNSAANPGWLNHRVNSSKPVLLVGLVQQAETSIENTAQYAGMAVPLRNAEKVLNSMQGGRTLFGTIGDVWGTPAREYMNNALADLCEVKDSRAVGDGVFAKLRSYAAAAALNANINVTLLQAASLPTAAAELGWGATGGAAVQFGKNILPWELTKIEQRMAEHGDELLAYRLRGTGTGEMASANAQKGFLGRSHDAARNSENKAVRGVTKAADKVIGLWTGGITKMDEITVAACWQGSESYVKAHPEEFAAGAEVVNSPEYWAAVNEKFEQVVEHTQPNYTTMQRTGFQRSDNAMVKALMMFSTQRQQNAQILTSAFEDYAAQGEWVKARKAAYKERPGAESKAALEEAQNAKDQAGQRVWRAVSSQVVQTAVIAALGVGVKFGLHRWQDLQDDNGDMTPWSVAWDFVRQFVKSFGSNWTGVSEAMTAVDLVTSGFTSTRSTISMNGIEVLNDVVRKIAKVYQLEAKDTSEMTEKQLDAYNAQMKEAIADMLGQFAAARGIPYANLKKQVQAVTGWMDTLANWNKEGGNFDSLPASATGQYDRLYNAYLNGDTVEAKAAIAKLNGMVEAGTIQENKMYEQMKQRLQQYEPRVTEAAKETNADHWEKRKELVDQMTSEIQQAFGGEQSDAHDCVVKAVDAKSNELLKVEKGYDKNSSIYAGLRDVVGSGSGQSVQDEYDRLVKAGKKPSSVKNEITKAAKADYVDGSDYDREQLAEMLLALTDKDGNALYEQKNLDDWVKQAEKNAEKEAQKENEFDRYDLLK
ncbi:MAG: hypothetical protein UEH50_09270 [Faecalibacterium sp.]|nr:hypothetical protein [Faecalibacterium sp.]